ncbi:MAG: type-F conjugative transfer system pilin assembly protein TrbC [Rhodospirillaceae bacterium]|nr:type-F conjugative transfer system pilin assembly protein TrbC [Rhodospirillaceae bacterium]
MLLALNRPGIDRRIRLAAGIAGLLVLGACACPARADDSRNAGQSGDAAASARGLVEEVLRSAGGDGDGSLGAWTRSIIDRALNKANETARQTVPRRAGQAAPLPAERHAARLGGDVGKRPASAEVLIFTSLSVPAASWRQWARDAARSGTPLVLRGVAASPGSGSGASSLPETARQIRARLGGHDAALAIDPRLFRLFGVERVPAVVVVPNGVPACESRGCSDDPAPPHDLIAGNIGLIAALEAVAAEGDAGRTIAKEYLQRLTGDGR